MKISLQRSISTSSRLLTATVFCISGVVAASASQLSAKIPSSTAPCYQLISGCKLGTTGPGGGIIFYDAGSMQWWGRYLEAWPGVPVVAFPTWGTTQSIYSGESEPQRRALQRRSMAIGMGRENTRQMARAGSPLAQIFSWDWYLPSKDELDALYRFRIPFNGPVWTSSESEDNFVWYQLFADGTQFTDANGIIPGLKTNKGYKKSPIHVGSGFKPQNMTVIPIRAFPEAPTDANSPPPAKLLTAVTKNENCKKSATDCKVGDVGPAGGIIVYDAGSDKPWGRYLEIAPKECEGRALSFKARTPIKSEPSKTSTSIGSGRVNSLYLFFRLLHYDYDPLQYKETAVTFALEKPCINKEWFLPSKDELNEAFRVLSHSRTGSALTPLGGFEKGYYWTSSDYNGTTAWTQYFADGQQFDRVQTLSANNGNGKPFFVRPMRAFKSGELNP